MNINEKSFKETAKKIVKEYMYYCGRDNNIKEIKIEGIINQQKLIKIYSTNPIRVYTCQINLYEY